MYPIGMICIGQNFKISTFRNDDECTIVDIGVFSCITDYGQETDLNGYLVKWADGEITAQEQEYLRPKHYPGSWDELEGTIGWRPREVIYD